MRKYLAILLLFACGLASAQVSQLGAFQATGKTVTVTAATSAPSPVATTEPRGAAGLTQYILNNIGVNVAFMSYAGTSAAATTNCVIPTGTAQWVYIAFPSVPMVVTAPSDSYWCGLTSSGTSVIYIVPGVGE